MIVMRELLNVRKTRANHGALLAAKAICPISRVLCGKWGCSPREKSMLTAPPQDAVSPHSCYLRAAVSNAN